MVQQQKSVANGILYASVLYPVLLRILTSILKHQLKNKHMKGNWCDGAAMVDNPK